MNYSKYLNYVLKTLACLVCSILLGFLMAFLIGLYMPKTFFADKSKTLNHVPEIVWETLVDVKSYPYWKKDVKRVEILAQSKEGVKKWREYYKTKDATTYEVLKRKEGRLFKIAIAESQKHIKGTWIYEINEYEGNGILYLKQDAIVESPYYRFYTKYIDNHLSDIDTFLFNFSKRLKGLSSEEEDTAPL